MYEADVVEESASEQFSRLEVEVTRDGNVSAKRALARLLADGARDVPADGPRAISLLEAIVADDPTADDLCLLALLLRSCSTSDTDAARIISLYERAIEQCPTGDASVHLAIMLSCGHGGAPHDEERALRLLSSCLNTAPPGDEIADADTARNMIRAATAVRARVTACPEQGYPDFDVLERAIIASGRASAICTLAHEFRALSEQLERAHDYHDEEATFTGDCATVPPIVDGGARALRLYESAASLGDVDAERACARLLLDGSDGVPCDAARAFELLERLFNAHGSSADAFQLALLLEHGHGDVVCANAQRAAQLYQRAIDCDNHFQAAINLGLMLGRGVGDIPKDENRAADLLAVAVGSGADVDANVHTVCWDVLNETRSNGTDLRLAARLLELSADRRDDSAAAARTYIGLARVIETGDANMPVDVPRAVTLYRRAGDEADALRALARILAHGARGVQTDVVEACKLLQRVVQMEERGDDLVELARLVRTGAEEDEVQAAALYQRAVDIDQHFDASALLAFMLIGGSDGVGVDKLRAENLLNITLNGAMNRGGDIEGKGSAHAVRRLLEIASGELHGNCGGTRQCVAFITNVVRDRGDANAQRALASLLFAGDCGVTKDAASAASLYERAVDAHEDPESMRRLAQMVRLGAPGVPADPARAMSLLRLALDIEDDPRDLVALGGLLYSDGDKSGALDLFERAANTHGSFDGAARLAFLLYESEDTNAHERAISILEEAIHENDFEGYNVEEALRVAAGREDMLVDSQRALQLVSRVVEARACASALASLGGILERGLGTISADAPAAVRMYELALENGDDAEALHNLAAMLRDGCSSVTPDRARAAELLTRAVDAFGRSEDMCELARLYRSGLGGVPIDVARAEELYRSAAIADENKRAIVHLAFMMERGEEAAHEPQRALGLLRAVLRAEDGAYFAVQLVFGIINGDVEPDVPVDAYRALSLLETAVMTSDDDDVGDSAAARALATMLEHGGSRIPPDASRAAGLYAYAADEQGDVEAMRRLAGLLTRGAIGVEVDVERAEELLRNAVASDGDGDDMCQLGWLLRRRGDGAGAAAFYERAVRTAEAAETASAHLAYMLDSGVELDRDSERALSLLTRAVRDCGDDGVAVSDAFALTRPVDDVPIDSESARKLLRLAVEQSNSAQSTRALASILAHGTPDAPADAVTAVALYRAAVDAGSVEAMVELAELLEKGADGVDQDCEQAMQLYKKAIARGESRPKTSIISG